MIKNNLKYIVLLLILYLLWAIALPFAFKCNVKNIQSTIQKTTGYNLMLSDAKLCTASVLRAKIVASEISILNKDNSKVLAIQSPIINIRVLPLLIGKVHIRTFEAKNIETSLTLKDDLYLGDYLIKIPDKKINTKIDRIKINKYNLSLVDKKSKTPISLVGNDFYYKETFNNIFTSGKNELFIKSQKSVANFDIKIPKKKLIRYSKVNLIISNLQLKPFTNIVQEFVPEITSMRGNINILCNNSSLKADIIDVAIITKDSAKSVYFPKEFKINSDFYLKSNKLYINELEAGGGNIHFGLSGEVDNFSSKKPNLDLKIDMPKSDAREIALILPPVIVPQFNVYKLKQHPFYGVGEAELRVKGKAPEPNVYGTVRVSEAYMIKPIKNAKKATINLNYEKKRFNMDVIVPTSPTETVYVTGDIDSYGDNDCDMRIRSSKSIDLETAQFVLNPLHEVLQFLMGPVPIMKLKGIGNIDIQVVGSKKDPHIWGDFNFINTDASFNDVHNLVLKNSTGNLNFNDQNARFITESGTINGQPATIDGRCNLFGKLDFDVIGKNQPLSNLLKTVQTSPMLDPIKSMLPPVEKANGNIDLILKLTGQLLDINDIRFNENLFAEGLITLKNNSIRIQGLRAKGLSGNIKFKNLDISLDVKSVFDEISKIDVFGDIKNGVANISVHSDRMNVSEFVKHQYKELDDCFVSLNAKYNGQIDKIELNKINCVSHILKDNKPVKNIKLFTGNLILNNGRLKLSNVYGFIKENPFNLNLTADNLSEDLTKAKFNGNLSIKNFDIRALNICKNINILPSNIISQLRNLDILYGNTDIIATVKNNTINAKINLNNINTNYKFKKTPKSDFMSISTKLINGQIVIKNNKMFINKMNFLVDDMPVLVYGTVENIFKDSKFDIHLNSKLLQKVFDNYWNVDTIYPIKVRGDILLGTHITGTKNKINTKVDLKLENNSSVYYMGATVGDTENPITVNTDLDILSNNIIRLNKFQYSKLISSQNNKQNIFPFVIIKGGLNYRDNKFYNFNNLTIKTEAPTDARIFNVIFRKPIIKQGQFTSDIKISGTYNSPKILGDMNIVNLNIPVLNTAMKEIAFDFTPQDIYIKSIGEVLSNKIKFDAKIKNNLSNSIIAEKVNVTLNHLNINTLISELQQIELKGFNEKKMIGKTITSSTGTIPIECHNLNVLAEAVTVKNLEAKNLVANCSLDKKMMFTVNNFGFDIAEGKINGGMKFNLLNNLFNMKMKATNVNANELLIAVFDLPNQIYGDLTGEIELSADGTTPLSSKETLSGKAIFVVKDGRMPKLGSLEYLLRAGNVFKSGITGITINSILDLVSPLKSGNFSSIDGDINIKDGIAEKIEIHSTSKDLNLFIKGNYNFVTDITDMKVFGQLSKKISTVFGTVGNLSLNSLFNTIGINLSDDAQLVNELNKIPGIELSNNAYRKFVVKIYGNSDSEDNVQSFKWIK